MKFRNRKLVHWIAILAVLMSSLAPVVSQAIAVAQQGQGFAMDLCSADGAKMQIQVQLQVQPDSQTDGAGTMKPCPYCVTHCSITPVFNTDLKFEVPQSFAMLPQLFYQSPLPLSAWVTPPSAAPPTKA